MNLLEFTTATNELAKSRCEAQSTALFAAIHVPLPESMLRFYWETGVSPEECLDEIDANAGI